MQHHLSNLPALSRAVAYFGLVGAVLAWAGPAPANESLPYRARFPVPQSILSQDEALGDDIVSVSVEAGADDDDAVVFEPDLTRAAIRAASAHARAQRPVPIDIIRNGFSARTTTGAPPERAVGLKLGADIFSVTTRVITPAGAEQGRDARIDWRLARPIANTGPGFIWSVSTEGGTGIAARPEQNANLLVGYRHQLMEHITVTSQVAMGGGYVFAPDGGVRSEFVPEVKLTANLGAFAHLPLDAALDVTLARKMPLVASDFETRGTAMLRFKYSLE